MRSLWPIVFACSLLVGPAPAVAAHPVACGTTWAAEDDCLLRLAGTRIRVKGTATASGFARVHVALTPTVVGTTDIPLIECSATGSGTASCTNEVLLPQVEDPREEVVLDCRVSGSAGGTYRCDTRIP